MSSQADRQANLLADCLSSLTTWKHLIDRHLEGDEKAAETNELEELVKEYCLIDFKSTNTSEACQEVLNYFEDESADPNIDVDALYNEKLAKKPTSFNGNYQQHRLWKEVFMGITDREIEEVQTQSQNEEAPDYEEMNDSIFYSNVFTPPVDPISKVVIRDPYKNRKCGHVYEFKFIVQYIKSMKKKAKCPYIGCGNKNIEMSELVQDLVLRDKINDYLKETPQESASE